MKVFSPIRLRPREVRELYRNIEKCIFPLISTREFVPILVSEFKKPYMFEPHFLGSNCQLLDMYCLRDNRFPYVYANGLDSVLAAKHYTSYSCIYDTYIRDDIQIPGKLDVGDLILS